MTWTTISDSNLAAGQPIRSVDIIGIKDNIAAVANGDSGAPAVTNAAFDDNEIGAEKFQEGTTERDWVLARLASASVGAVGTYAMLAVDQTQSDPGDTAAGSALYYCATHSGQNGTSPSGTWRCMGYTASVDYTDTGGDGGGTLWLRIA